MSLLTVEGIVVNGRIRLPEGVELPERAKVYVVVPDVAAAPTARVFSPRLARREDAADFAKQVIEAPTVARRVTALAAARSLPGRSGGRW